MRGVTTPLSTATRERYFSKLGIIKNKLRNRLETPILDKLLRVSLVNQKQFDLNGLIATWMIILLIGIIDIIFAVANYFIIYLSFIYLPI